MSAPSASAPATPAGKLPPYQAVFPAEEFAARRRAISESIGADACAVLQGGDSTGAFDRFRQTNEFFYLTGVEVPHAYLFLQGKDGQATLYLPARDEKLERTDGPQLNCDNAEAVSFLTGIPNIRPLEALSSDLNGATRIFTPFAPAEGRLCSRDLLLHAQKAQRADPWRLPGTREDHFREKLKSIRPQAEILDLSPALDRSRLIKSPREVQQMRRAGRLTALAVYEAMRATKPGLYEYHLASIAEFVFQLNGSLPGGGYRPIVASGKNIWNSHYYQNSAQLTDGDWVLMDFAPDCTNYTSDIGRYWPINGRFAPWQRELYTFMVTYHKTLLKLIRPGVMADDILKEAAAKMETVINSQRWSRPSFEQAARESLKYRGHLSHCVGMAVHDAGNYFKEPLRPGLVFALDPQLWVPSEEIYVRVEDTVVVTEEGVEILTEGVPFEPDEIESLLNQPGRGSLLGEANNGDASKAESFISISQKHG